MKTLLNCPDPVVLTSGITQKNGSQEKLKLMSTMVILLLLLASFVSGQKGITIIDSTLNAYYQEGKLNGNILIAEKGQIIYSRSFGYANAVTGEKLNEHSVFGLASVSKQFTAMAIAMLKEQGKLNYDDKITTYFPELTAYDQVTIRNLLNHTSGLIPEMEQLSNTREGREYLSTRLTGNTATNKDIIAFLSIYKPKLRFTPNTKYEYCNTGYLLLASVIEKVTGLTYAEYLEKAIFKPLEMNHTFNYSPDILPDTIKNFAYDYMYSESSKKYGRADSLKGTITLKGAFYGGGTIYSTVLDLLKWDRALYTEKLISFSGLKEIFNPNVLSDHTKTDYGFGWQIRDDPNFGKSVYHEGSFRGYNTYIERNVDHDKTIIILQNHNWVVFPVDMINHNLYHIDYPDEVTLSREQLEALAGTYEIQKGFDLKIWSENGNIYGQATGQKAFQLFAENELLLFTRVTEIKLQFEKNQKENIVCLYILQHGDKRKALRK